MTRTHGGRIVLLAAVLLAWSAPARTAEVDPCLPDDTEILVSINIRQIMDSEIIKKYALEPLKVALQDERAKEVCEALGFNPLTDLTSIALAGPGEDDESKGLVIARGKFDQRKFDTKAEELVKQGDHLKAVEAGGHRFYQITARLPGQKNDAFFAALADRQTLLLAPSKQYLVDALDRHAGKKKAAPAAELRGLVEKVDGKQSFWVVALATGLRKQQLAKDDKAKEILDKLTAVSAGITIAGDVQVQADVAAKDGNAADDLRKQISEGLDQAKTLAALFANNQPDLAPLADVLDTIKVAGQGKSISIKGQVASDIITKLMKRLP